MTAPVIRTLDAARGRNAGRLGRRRKAGTRAWAMPPRSMPPTPRAFSAPSSTARWSPAFRPSPTATTFGFIGLYICQPEYRGRGLGRAVWDAGMERLGGRTIGLDGVPEQQANYRSMGFVPAYESVRLTGRPLLNAGTFDVSDEVDLAQISAIDAVCFPAAREGFLKAWLAPPRIVRAISDDRGLRGYGVVRPCLDGHKVGPLFADSTETAMAILAALIEAVDGPVQIDAPLLHPEFTDALALCGHDAWFLDRTNVSWAGSGHRHGESLRRYDPRTRLTFGLSATPHQQVWIAPLRAGNSRAETAFCPWCKIRCS